jgi:hypothetical protein
MIKSKQFQQKQGKKRPNVEKCKEEKSSDALEIDIHQLAFENVS